MRLSSKTLTAAAIVAVAGIAVSGCASHRFVRDNVAVVDNRVTALDGRVNQVEGTANEALARATAAHKLAEGKLLYEVVLSDDSVKFPLNANTLSPEAEQRLSALVQQLRAENKNVYLEIQGHTDSAGDAQLNERLGLERAETVRRYLSEQGIPLNRMATISYGETKPIAPNDTREGRAQNRRVAIVVLH
ncbi:OmpA family protein [Brevundimonas vesicularis]|uniref:OmpA family protein n=1 Tax=Brevundimonas vesicularis TaxID=41276 RepID=UPI0038D3DE57